MFRCALIRKPKIISHGTCSWPSRRPTIAIRLQFSHARFTNDICPIFYLFFLSYSLRLSVFELFSRRCLLCHSFVLPIVFLYLVLLLCIFYCLLFSFLYKFFAYFLLLCLLLFSHELSFFFIVFLLSFELGAL